MLDWHRAMARNNLWSNHRLLKAAAALDEAAFKAERTSFFPSLHATLNHILAVDLYYLDALTEGGVGPRGFSDYRPSAMAADLMPRQEASDRRLVAFCDGLTAADLERTVVTDRGERGPFEEQIGALLMHLFTHQTHHRGQAHAMLAGTDVPPPQLDEYFLVFDEPLRRAEIAALFPADPARP
jgi:uncharacterized damage-inducible protein DinB